MRKQVLIILTLVVLAGSSGSGSQMGRYASRNLSSVSELTHQQEPSNVREWADSGTVVNRGLLPAATPSSAQSIVATIFQFSCEIFQFLIFGI